MIPSAFEYLRAHSVDEALMYLQKHGADARELAGGQSLITAMRFRLARQAMLVDTHAIKQLHLPRVYGCALAIRANARGLYLGQLQTFVDLTISPAVGAEVIAGSTRLKAGTATKMVLNMLTTGAMIRIGKTYGNLMVDVQTGSEKLKDRARRIVNIVTGLEYDEADKLLKRAHWNVKAAIVMQKTGLPYPKALSRLRKAHDSMREALGEDIEPRLRGMLQGAAEAAGNGRG